MTRDQEEAPAIVFIAGTAGLGGTVTTPPGTITGAADQLGPVEVMVRPEWITPKPDTAGDSVSWSIDEAVVYPVA